MISFNYETDFELPYEHEFSSWISKVIISENCKESDINYIFCDDEYLHDINLKYLNHDTLTDIISFDYSVGKELHGDIYISIERVKENAEDFEVDFKDEIRRVMVHGVLHYCGYKDKTDDDQKLMRSREDHYISQWS